MQDLGGGRMAWVGHAAEDRHSRVVLGASGDAVAGTFAYRGRLYKLEPRANGRHVVSEVEKRDPAPEHDPIPVFDVSGGQSAAPVSGDAGAHKLLATGRAARVQVDVIATPRLGSEQNKKPIRLATTTALPGVFCCLPARMQGGKARCPGE